jgi:hypothetical protein
MEPNPRTSTTNPASAPPPNGTPGIELQRTLGGQFRPGHSGNPAGRPRSESAALRQKLTERAVEVVQAVLDAALSGDMTAAKMILDRCRRKKSNCRLDEKFYAYIVGWQPVILKYAPH